MSEGTIVYKSEIEELVKAHIRQKMGEEPQTEADIKELRPDADQQTWEDAQAKEEYQKAFRFAVETGVKAAIATLLEKSIKEHPITIIGEESFPPTPNLTENLTQSLDEVADLFAKANNEENPTDAAELKSQAIKKFDQFLGQVVGRGKWLPDDLEEALLKNLDNNLAFKDVKFVLAIAYFKNGTGGATGLGPYLSSK